MDRNNDYRRFRVDKLDSRLPRWLIEVSFGLMLLSAINSLTDIGFFPNLYTRVPILVALLRDVGMVVLYFAVMRGMASLYHPLTRLWWLCIALNLLGSLTTSLGPRAETLDFISSSLLSLAYLPLGALLCFWYRGGLYWLGVVMASRILVLQVLSLILLAIFEIYTNVLYVHLFDVFCLIVEVVYAWLLRRLVV